MTLNKPVTGGGTLNLPYDGTLILGAASHRIRRLELPAEGRKIALPEGFVLPVQELSLGKRDQPEGDYTSANCANIVSGTVRVSRDALVCDDPLVTLRRDGNVLYADVAKKGLTILVK